MKVTITKIVLKSPFHFFKLSATALQILKQLKKTNYVDFKKTGFWTTHYTMTMWNTEKDMKDFANNGAHLEAMKISKQIASELSTITIDAEKLPDWKTAKDLLGSVKVIKFD